MLSTTHFLYMYNVHIFETELEIVMYLMRSSTGVSVEMFFSWFWLFSVVLVSSDSSLSPSFTTIDDYLYGKVLLSKHFRLHSLSIHFTFTFSSGKCYTAKTSEIVFCKTCYTVIMFTFLLIEILFESFSRHIDVWFSFLFIFYCINYFRLCRPNNFQTENMWKFGISMWSRKYLGEEWSKPLTILFLIHVTNF